MQKVKKIYWTNMIKQKYIGLSWGREYSSLPLEGWVNFLTLTKQADDV